MSIAYHRNHDDGGDAPKWWTEIPLYSDQHAFLRSVPG